MAQMRGRISGTLDTKVQLIVELRRDLTLRHASILALGTVFALAGCVHHTSAPALRSVLASHAAETSKRITKLRWCWSVYLYDTRDADHSIREATAAWFRVDDHGVRFALQQSQDDATAAESTASSCLSGIAPLHPALEEMNNAALALDRDVTTMQNALRKKDRIGFLSTSTRAAPEYAAIHDAALRLQKYIRHAEGGPSGIEIPSARVSDWQAPPSTRL